MGTLLSWLGCNGFYGIGSGLATKSWRRFLTGLSVIGILLILFVLALQSGRESTTSKTAISSEEEIKGWPFQVVDEHLGLYFPSKFADLPVSAQPDTDSEWIKSAHSFAARTPNMNLLVTKSKAPPYDIDQVLAAITYNFQKAHGNLSVQLEPTSTPDDAKTKLAIFTVNINGRRGKVTVLIILYGQTEYYISGSGSNDAFDKTVHETIRDF